MSGEPASSDPIELHADDVPDPHYLGAGLHGLAFEQIVDRCPGALAPGGRVLGAMVAPGGRVAPGEVGKAR